ncbi:F0F1 ATP synthase subunit B' [Paenirhodobacter enshiensis]|uniref:ATP synthase subunit b n=1 Tax=Paenirhodobacter enshiensis TaxID=1105367 RepID=A0A086Y5Z1_9RHOB|nr:F0F1 ATP synthase subunit B' [Paenirhodobacter enshiensis]KFI29691.1 ATP F0F1 synthase subunit B' [Paenirhodobacter enshiensis]
MATEQMAAQSQSSGMPQLDFSTFPNQIFWLVVALVVIYLVLSRIALPRISSILAERQNTISGDVAAAEDYKAKAREAEAAYEKALADARSQAQKIVAEMQAELKKQIDAATAKADADITARAAASEAKIAEIRSNALVTVEAVAKDTAAEIVAALGGKADAAALADAVATRVKG